MWITAEYTTGKKNQEKTVVTIYDKIIPRIQPQKHKVVLKDQFFEYPIIDCFNSLE
jgi:hypothetical protein